MAFSFALRLFPLQQSFCQDPSTVWMDVNGFAIWQKENTAMIANPVPCRSLMRGGNECGDCCSQVWEM